MEEGRSSFQILRGKPTGKRPLRKSRRRQKDKVRIELNEICVNTINWVDSTQNTDYWGALVNAALYLQVS